MKENTKGDLDSPEFGIKSTFGKIYWSLLQELGVATLLKLAVGDTGLAVATRARPSENREIHRSAPFAVRGGGRDISQVLTIIFIFSQM